MKQNDNGEVTPRKIYKYVTVDRVDALANQKVRYTQPMYLNDKFDLYPNLSQAVSNEEEAAEVEKFVSQEVLDYLVIGNFYSHLEETLKRFPEVHRETLRRMFYESGEADKLFEVFSTSSYTQEKLEQYKRAIRNGIRTNNLASVVEVVEELRSNYGVLSLTDEPDNHQMWALYAGTHTGFVIEFDGEHPFFDWPHQPGVSALSKVVYAGPEPLPHGSGEYRRLMFLTKDVGWQSEQEWRMIFMLNELGSPLRLPDGAKVYLRDFPAECVTGVIFGADMSNNNRQKVRELLEEDRYKHVTTSQILVDGRKLDVSPY